MTEATVETSSMEATLGLFGNFDENIKQIEKALDVSIFLRGNEIKNPGLTSGVVVPIPSLVHAPFLPAGVAPL